MGFKKRGMIWIVLLLALSLIVQSAENIQIKGLVNDYANIISPEYTTKIESMAKELYDSGAAQFSIVTINNLEGRDIEGYALELAQGKLGDTEKNNGLLFLVSLEDRKYRFEVGRGLEPILNDAKIGRIGRTYLIDNFRNEEYGKGIYEASLAVKTTILGETDSNYYVTEEPVRNVNFALIQFFVILGFWIFMVILIVSLRKKRYGKGKGKDNHFFDAALIAAIMFGGRRGGFGGMGGGGFGGFGGGGFGGGGASGGW